MSAGLKFTGLLLAGVLCLPFAAGDDTQTPHRAHKPKKQALPPLPSGTQGPVPQVPLDAIPAVAPEVTFQDGLLTIVAPNSTLGDILRSVRKHTAADIEVPPTANERVVTRLGPAPAREVMAELLNGSHFNYILLGSESDANALVRVVLVAKTPDTPANASAPAQQAANTSPQPAEADAAEDAPDDTPEPAAAEAEQPAAQPDQPGVKTPQQMLQEMQQRQLQMQQQQQSGQSGQTPVYPPPSGMPTPQRPPQQSPQNQ